MGSKLAYKIAKKPIDDGSIICDKNPSNWYIRRTRAGRHQLASGAFRWELIHKDGFPSFGCYERASDIIKGNFVLTNYSFTSERIIEIKSYGH